VTKRREGVFDEEEKIKERMATADKWK